MKGFKRTNYCGEIKENMIGKEVKKKLVILFGQFIFLVF